MTKYIVEGGRPLFGEIHISGAKNAAVAIIPAALLVDGVCRIENLPQISDVTIDSLQLDYRSSIRFRMAVEDDAAHVGGLTIFGKTFGNYGQDIKVSLHYAPMEEAAT